MELGQGISKKLCWREIHETIEFSEIPAVFSPLTGALLFDKIKTQKTKEKYLYVHKTMVRPLR